MAAVVEPAADVPAVRFGGSHRLLALRRRPRLEERRQVSRHLVVFGFDLQPIFLCVVRDASLRLPIGVGPAPALPGLLGVVFGVEVAEDLQPLLRRQLDVHLSCLQVVVDDRDHLRSRSILSASSPRWRRR